MAISLSVDRLNKRVYLGMASDEWDALGCHALTVQQRADGTIYICGNSAGLPVRVTNQANDRVSVNFDDPEFVILTENLTEGYYRMKRERDGWVAVKARELKRYTRGEPKAAPSFVVLMDDAEFSFPTEMYARVMKTLTRLEDELAA